ncbi:MAG: hypothetical protein VX541_00210, partial [Candidatus Poribacteria bacterium]|nr:hypothetical protein [Candidatus Poribacteria bacterium]
FGMVIGVDAAPKPVEITDLKVADKSPYEIGEGLKKGSKYYIDRDYTVLEMPADMVGIQWIMTGNSQKGSKGAVFVTFTVDRPSIIWIGYDSRGNEAKKGVPPAWLTKDYKMAAGTIKVTDGNMDTFNLWKRTVPAGKVEIPGNAEAPAKGFGSNYLVLVEAGLNTAVSPKTKLSTTWSRIKSVK